MMNFLIDSKSIEDEIIKIQSRSVSDPSLSDIDFKNEMAWIWTAFKNPLYFVIEIGVFSRKYDFRFYWVDSVDLRRWPH